MFVVFAEGSKLSVHAVDIPPEKPSFFSFPRPEANTEMFVLHYACTLEKLGYPRGELDVRTDGEGAPLPPRPRAILKTAEIDGEPFQELSALPEAIKTLRVAVNGPPPSPCTSFRGELYTIEGEPEDIGFAVVLDENRAMLGTWAGNFYIFDGQNISKLTELSTTTPSLAGFMRNDGMIELIGAGGETAVGHPDRGFERGPKLPMPSKNKWIHISGPTGDPENKELYAMSNDETFHRFDGNVWTAVATASSAMRGDSAAVWIAPELAAASGLSDDDLVIYDHGEIRRLKVPLNPTFEAELRPAFRHPELGVIVGTSTGELYLTRDLERWEQLVRYPVLERIRAFAPYGGNFLVGTDNGAMTEYVLDYGHCDLPAFTARSVVRIVPFPKAQGGPTDRFIVVTDRRGPTTFVVIEAENTPDACVP